MDNKIDVSLILPCFNEFSHFRKNVDSIIRAFESFKLNYEIIFVDDCSQDDTLGLIKQYCERHDNFCYLSHEKNLGRGRSVSDGVRSAKGHIVGFLDIDLEVDILGFIKLVLQLNKNGADVATVYRIYKLKIGILHRWVLGRGYNVLVNLIFKTHFKDTETGCKAFLRKKIMPVLDETRDPHWFWDTEIMLRCAKHNLNIVELPFLFERNPAKPSTVKIFRDIWYYLICLYRNMNIMK